MFGYNQDLSKWHLSEVRESDLLTIAGWLADALPLSREAYTSHKERILHALKIQYHERRRTSWPHEYMGLLGETPIFTVYGYIDQQYLKYPGRKSHTKDYHLSMTMNLSLASFEELWEPAWHLTLKHFFSLPDVSCVITQVEDSNSSEKAALSGLGFKSMPSKIAHQLTFACLKQDFVSLKTL